MKVQVETIEDVFSFTLGRPLLTGSPKFLRCSHLCLLFVLIKSSTSVRLVLKYKK